MYSYNEQQCYNGECGLPRNFYSSPIQSEDFYDAMFDERQYMTMFPFQGGTMGPPQGPPPGFPSPYPSQGQGPGMPGFPPSQGPDVGPPTSPPPAFVPTQSQQATAFAVDPGSIRGCLFRFTYVWLRGNQQFWFYPTFVGRKSVSGYRWNGFRWVYFGISLRQIQSFTCV